MYHAIVVDARFLKDLTDDLPAEPAVELGSFDAGVAEEPVVAPFAVGMGFQQCNELSANA